MRTTQKEIKRHLNNNNNLNNFTDEEIRSLNLKEIAYSVGTYGVNGALFLSQKNFNYYVVPNRSTQLFKLI